MLNKACYGVFFWLLSWSSFNSNSEKALKPQYTQKRTRSVFRYWALKPSVRISVTFWCHNKAVKYAVLFLLDRSENSQTKQQLSTFSLLPEKKLNIGLLKTTQQQTTPAKPRTAIQHQPSHRWDSCVMLLVISLVIHSMYCVITSSVISAWCCRRRYAVTWWRQQIRMRKESKQTF